MISEAYSLGDGQGLALESADPSAVRFYREEYNWAERRGSDGGVALRWQRQPFPLFSPGDGHFHSHKLLARWRYRVSLLQEQVSIEASGNRWALPMVHHMLVHPSLRLLSSQHGTLLLHGAALVHEGQTVVLTGPGGSGKTTTSSLLLAYGSQPWKLHADDYVFLASSGETLPYLTRAHLYLDLVEHLPQAGDRLTATERRHLQIFGRIRRWSGDRLKWPLRIRQERLWPKREVARGGRLGAIFWLRRAPHGNPQAVRVARWERAVDGLVDMNFREARHFLSLLEEVQEGRSFARRRGEWRQGEATILRGLAEEHPIYYLDVPDTWRDAEEVAKRLEEIILERIDTKMPATG